MANVKISQLTAITSSDDLADADIIPLVDSSDSTTKRAALSVLCSYFGGGGGSSVWCTGTNTAYLLTDCVGIGTATPGTDIMLRVQGDSCYTGDLKIGGDVCIGGDDLFMGTNTSGHMLIADGTNFNPVAMSGDVGIDNSGATTIQASSVENSMLAGSIANAKLANDSVSYGGVSLDLGATDATPAFNLCDATGYPTSSLVGTITNAQLAGSIANAKLANDSVSYGGVSVDLGSTDATPAFNLCDATGYPTSSLVGTITNAQLAGSIANAKLANDSVSYGGVSVDLGSSDATPAFNLCDATAYKGDSALVTVGTITSGTWNGTAIGNSYLANSSVSYGGVSVALGATDATPAFNLCDATAYKGDSALVTVGTVTSGTWQGTAVATGYIAGTICDKTLASPVLCGTISGNAFLDEDNMASDSATKVASQQSIKAYVDSVASGLDLKCSSHAATTANLSAAYNNGTSGVGATLTNSGTQAALSVDGQTMASGERVLVKDQSTAAQNGIYTVTTVGDGSTNWVLTRATDFDTSTEITSGAFTFVETGSSNADSGWVMTTDGTVTVGTTSLAWSQFSGAGQITAGDGMTKSGNTLNVGAGSNLLVSADAVAMCSIVTGLTTVCATNFAGTLATAAQTNVTSVGTLTALTVDNICLDGTTIGHTDDTDLMTLADGVLTVSGRLDAANDIKVDAIRRYSDSSTTTKILLNDEVIKLNAGHASNEVVKIESGAVTIDGDLTVCGDDITMGTNTSGHILVADGTNYNPVAVSGDVTISNTGAVTIAATSVENSMLAGSIANAKLANDSVSYGGVSLDLGGTDATPAFNLCDATAYKGDSALVTSGALNSGSITSGFGNIDNGSSTITTTGAVSTGALTSSGNVSFDGGTFVFNESGADKDFRIEGDSEANLFVADASTDRIGIGTATPGYLLDTFACNATYAAKIQNVTGGDGLYIKAGGSSSEFALAVNNFDDSVGILAAKADGNIGIGTAAPDSMLHVYSATAGKPILTLENTNADEAGATLKFLKDSSSPADGDNLGKIQWWGDDDGGTSTSFADMYGQSADVSNTTEDGSLTFRTMAAGTMTSTMVLSSGSVGIGTATPDQLLHIEESSGGDKEMQFQIENTGVGDAAMTYKIAAQSWSSGVDNNEGDRFVISSSDNLEDNPRLVITSAGNVGIGTGAPGDLLHLSSSGGLSLALQSTHANIANTFKLTVSDPSGTTGTTGSGIAFSSNEVSRGFFFRQDGNVGIGTTAPAKLLHVYGATDTTDGTDPIARFERNGSSQTGIALMSNSLDGLVLRADSSGFGAIHSYEDLGFYTGVRPGTSYGDVAMRIETNGNVGIGTSQADSLLHIESSGAATAKLQIESTHASAGYPTLAFKNDATTWNIYAPNGGSGSRPDAFQIENSSGGTFLMETNGRVEIYADPSGNSILHMVQSHSSAPHGVNLDFSAASPDDNSQWAYRFEDSTTVRFIVYSSGDVENHDNSYSGISDSKLKQDVEDARDYWDDFKQIRFRKFKFKADVEKYGADANSRFGVVAQEAESVFPSLVTESPDQKQTDGELVDLGTTTKGFKYSILNQIGLKVVQELQARLETAEAKIAALEAA